MALDHPTVSTTGITTIRKSAGTDDFRRVEVITGVGRRRSWPEATKAQILAETLQEGAVIAAIARKHNVSASQIYEWRKQARSSALREGHLAEVVVQDQERSEPSKNVPAVLPPPMIEIAFDGALVRITSGSAPETVEAVLRGMALHTRRR